LCFVFPITLTSLSALRCRRNHSNRVCIKRASRWKCLTSQRNRGVCASAIRRIFEVSNRGDRGIFNRRFDLAGCICCLLLLSPAVCCLSGRSNHQHICCLLSLSLASQHLLSLSPLYIC
jgi:hypothetical protein